jgi:hypothetical protein
VLRRWNKYNGPSPAQSARQLNRKPLGGQVKTLTIIVRILI